MPRRLTVFGWHNVAPTWCFDFAAGAGYSGMVRQMRTLRRIANVVPLGEALATLTDGGELPPRAVALTFDDGYRDNLGLAAPMLGGLGLPATFFLAPTFLDHTLVPWWELLGWAVTNATAATVVLDDVTYDVSTPTARRATYSALSKVLKRRDTDARLAGVDELVAACEPSGSHAERAAMMDWDDAAEMVRRGFEIGSHSMRHAILSEETAEAQAADLAAARRRLQDELGIACELLAYPNGSPADYDAATIAAAQAAGHTHAITTIDGFSDADTPPFEIRRFLLYPERGLVEAAALAKWGVAQLRGRNAA